MTDKLSIQFRWMVSDEVNIKELKTNGTVRKVLWNGNGREYFVSYFINGKHELDWFYEDELGELN